jgi:uncharacterized surface protein with fasciclin (FAS1) repeats
VTAVPTTDPPSTQTFSDEAEHISFDYLNDATLSLSSDHVSLIQGNNFILVYTPSRVSSVTQSERFESSLEELKFFVSERGFTVVGPETDATSFGKELAHVSVAMPAGSQKGTAFLVDLGGEQHAVVLWMTPQDETLSASMLQTLIKIMTTIDHTGESVDAADPTPTVVATSTPEITATSTPLASATPESDTAVLDVLTFTSPDLWGDLTFDYLSGVTFDESTLTITMIRHQDNILIYTPFLYYAAVQERKFNSNLEALEFFVEQEGLTLVGTQTEDTSFGKELAHVSIERAGDKGTAFLVDVGNKDRVVVLWLTPKDQTLSAAMLQTLIKIMATIHYEPAEFGESTPLPTAVPTIVQQLPSTVMNAIVIEPDLSTVATSLVAAGLLDELTTDDYTVFAPTNAAFEAMLDEMNLTVAEFWADSDLVTAVLSYHVIPGKLLPEDLENGNLTTLSGEKVSIRLLGSDFLVNDVLIVKPEMEAENGVIYVINEVLMPPDLPR